MSLAHELAWCAGFFDGEGFVTIQKRNSKVNGKQYTGFYLRVGVNHVAIEPLLALQKILGGTIRQQSPEKVSGNRKPRHSWQMSCSDAGEALKKLMPYLRNKQKVVELGLEFQSTIGPHGQKVPEETNLYRLLLKDTISFLNAKD